MLWTIFIIVGTIVIDQWTKYLAVVHLQPRDTLPIWQDMLHLTYLENRGAAFGMLSDKRWVFMLLSTVAIVVMLWWLYKEKPASPWVQTAGALIIGGGIGNMIDRVRLGYVVDFIDVRAIDFYVFNGADSFVCVGCGMIVAWVLYMELVKKQPALDMLFCMDTENTDDKPGEENDHESTAE